MQAHVHQDRAQHSFSGLVSVEHVAHHGQRLLRIAAVVGLVMVGQDLALGGADLHACHVRQVADRVGDPHQLAQLHRAQWLQADRGRLRGDRLGVAARHLAQVEQLALGQEGHQQRGRDQGGYQRHKGQPLHQRRALPQACGPGVGRHVHLPLPPLHYTAPTRRAKSSPCRASERSRPTATLARNGRIDSCAGTHEASRLPVLGQPARATTPRGTWSTEPASCSSEQGGVVAPWGATVIASDPPHPRPWCRRDQVAPAAGPGGYFRPSVNQ